MLYSKERIRSSVKPIFYIRLLFVNLLYALEHCKLLSGPLKTNFLQRTVINNLISGELI